MNSIAIAVRLFSQALASCQDTCVLADCAQTFVGSPYGLPPTKDFRLPGKQDIRSLGAPRKQGRKQRSTNSHVSQSHSIIGYTGKDAESRNIRGTHKVSFSVCTNESWQDENGDWQQKATWHNCVVWGGNVADFACTLDKGAYLMVEGKLVKRDYEREIQAGKSSIKVPALAVEIVVSKIIKLSRPGKAQNADAEAEAPAEAADSGFEPV